MNIYRPDVNIASIRNDLIELSRRDELGRLITRVVEHSSKRDLIVVFDAEPDQFEVGRILLFQDFLYAHTGIVAAVAAQHAHCIKVFFDLGVEAREKRQELIELFNSDHFEDLRDGLSISYIQFAGQIIPPQRYSKK